MKSERWHQITEMFHVARERDPGHRDAFLADACGEDATLRREVEAMLDGHDNAGRFGETPLFTSLGPDQEMRLAPGARLGPYEIITALGSGGMGEVYRAQGHEAHRDVALKVLPDLFANDPDRLARSQREARVLASLNHPNIAGDLRPRRD